MCLNRSSLHHLDIERSELASSFFELKSLEHSINFDNFESVFFLKFSKHFFSSISSTANIFSSWLFLRVIVDNKKYFKLLKTKKWRYISAVILNMKVWEAKLLPSVIVWRVKVSVAILTDPNLLPYRAAITQLRNFNKGTCTL